MKTVVGVLPSLKEAKSVVHELEILGVAPKELKVVPGVDADPRELKRVERSRRGTSEAAIAGALCGAVGGILIGALMLSLPGVHPFFMSSVPVTLAVFAVIGAILTALMMAVFNMGRPHDEAPLYDEAVREKGVAVAAHVQEKVELNAVRVLSEHGARDLHADADSAWTTSAHPYPCDSNMTAH